MHPLLHPWQADLVTWAVETSRAAIWADTGLGKTLIQLEWARLSTDHGALIVAPLAVCQQTVREAAKIGLRAHYARDASEINRWLTHDGHLCPVWYGIKETDTLNTAVAREAADERHICPLQLGFIDRCVRLWSNPGELILTPFAGIGSELYQAVKLGRRAVGIELKPSYWQTAVDNLTRLEFEMEVPSLFDLDGAAP